MTFDVGTRFLVRSRYYLGLEYPAKIRSAVLALPAERLWFRPDPASNSAGNLVLHLAGNVRQWVVSGIQIILLAKLYAPGEIRFYEDSGGLARPTFLGDGRSDVE
ncbi:MAG: hypothetical protein IPP20_14405 [Gemmatimonadetes bacterium]|nr:hypothetical protein [Gemmatimonadota bacterium]